VQGRETKDRLANRAGRLLARRLYSCGEMKLKLLAYATEKEVDATLTRLKELNLLNDNNYAYNLALFQMAKQGWGPIKVLHSLLRHQVSTEVARSAIERVRKAEGCEVALTRYLERFFRKCPVPENRKELVKLVNRLRMRGFEEDTIFSILRQRIPTAVWRKFDMGE